MVLRMNTNANPSVKSAHTSPQSVSNLPCSSLSRENREELASLLFPAETPTIDSLREKYPPRNLPADAKVLRVAPSPTGFFHVGTVYVSVINRLLATQSGGVFILRIEDTDEKREVPGGTAQIIQTLNSYALHPDEGFVIQNGQVAEVGAYGPYKQSDRKATYLTFARELVRMGLAYPCFCSPEELKEIEAQQMATKTRPGYYGRWAKWRDASLVKIKTALADGQIYVIRFRAWGDGIERMIWKDGIKGAVSAPANINDPVIIKSDLGSLYNFAHIIDDYLMGVTDVIRGDEYVSSMPMFTQLYEATGIPIPRLYHFGPLAKLEIREEVDPETGETRTVESKRKLSKRKDPDANVDHFKEHGYPEEAVIDYLLNIANSNYEEWRIAHPTASIYDFPLDPGKLTTSAAIFDLAKLHDVSRETIARFSTSEIYDRGLSWAKSFDPALGELMDRYPDYTQASIAIERDTAKGAKRITLWTDLRPQLFWFYDEEFEGITEFPYPEHISPALRSAVISKFLETYSPADDNQTWFTKCKEGATALGFAAVMKEYKQKPDAFVGNIADYTMIIRVAVSGRRETPDLHSVLAVLGAERVRERLERQTR